MADQAADALALLSALVLEDQATWGARAYPWQRADAAAVVDPTDPRLHYLTRPRGGSKTSDLAGAAIALLLTQAPARARAFAYAADLEQAQLFLDAIGGFVARTDGLGGLLTVERSRVIATHTDATLSVESSDDASAWGRRPWLVLVDELAQWRANRQQKRLWSAIVSALPKVPGSRLVVLTSAGDPAHWSHAVLQRARESARWRVSQTPGPVPWQDPDDLEEQRALLTESQYQRLILNRWTSPEDSLTDHAALRDAVTLDGPQDPRPGVRYVAGVDLGLRRDRTAIAVAHADGPRVALDRLVVFDPAETGGVKLARVEEAVTQLHHEYRCRVKLDPWQAIGLAQRLRSRGVPVDEVAFTQQSVGRLATTLHTLLRDRLLDLPPDDELLDELGHVRLRETGPGIMRMDHDSSRHDDRAIALALAAQELRQRPGATKVSAPPRGAKLTDWQPHDTALTRATITRN